MQGLSLRDAPLRDAAQEAGPGLSKLRRSSALAGGIPPGGGNDLLQAADKAEALASL